MGCRLNEALLEAGLMMFRKDVNVQHVPVLYFALLNKASADEECDATNA